MQIIIVGCGKVGSTIAEQLSAEGHDITIVDTDESVVQALATRLDIMGVTGNGATHSILAEAGVEESDLLIAVTESDELNLLCCMVGKKAGADHTIARVRNPEYSQDIGFMKKELGLAMTINPEYAASTEMARLLRFPSAIEIDTFGRGRVELLEYKIEDDNILAGKSLIDVGKNIKSDILICAVERGEDVIIPNGSFVLKSGDIISVVASTENARDFFKKVGCGSNEVKDTMIVGGGTIAYYLANQLIPLGIKVKIIEKSHERCEELSAMLPNAVIIHGDAADKDVLLEEGIENCSSFVSLTGIDEENAFLSLYAKSVSNAKIVTKINRISFDDIIEKFDLGSMIYPKHITAEYIVRYVRGLQNSVGSNNVEALYKIIHGEAEALEFYIKEDSSMTDKTLEAMPIREGVLVAGIIRNGKVMIPNGKSVFQKNDSVIVITKITGMQNLEDILK